MVLTKWSILQCNLMLNVTGVCIIVKTNRFQIWLLDSPNYLMKFKYYNIEEYIIFWKGLTDWLCDLLIIPCYGAHIITLTPGFSDLSLSLLVLDITMTYTFSLVLGLQTQYYCLIIVWQNSSGNIHPLKECPNFGVHMHRFDCVKTQWCLHKMIA